MTEPAGAMNAIRDVDELTEEEIEGVERILMILRGERSRRTPRGGGYFRCLSPSHRSFIH